MAGPEATPQRDTPNRKVLVVDGDAVAREDMARQLAGLGWRVTTEATGEAAIAALSRHLPDLAIIGIGEPELDGLAVLGHVRQNPETADLPVIVCACRSDREPIDKACAIGASSVVIRPIDWPQFRHHARFVMRCAETSRALRAAEAEVRDTNRVKNAMVQILSHELKTPLTALIGLTEVMEKALRGRIEPALGQHLDDVMAAAQRLNATIGDIMLLARAMAGEQRFAPQRLSETLDDSLSGFKIGARSRRIRLLARPPERDVEFMCDGRLILQAVGKLVDNAIRFSPEGGTVEVRGEVKAGDWIKISVKDTGPGLSKARLKECLQPFVQDNMGYARSSEGLGLGLPIAQAICKAHGGELTVRSSPGNGMVVSMVLPGTRVRNETPGLDDTLPRETTRLND